VGQNLILRFIKQKVDESIAAQKNLPLNSIHKAAVTVHYVLATLLVFVILQMLITSRYDVVFLTTGITISYVFAIIMMVILCHRFFSWFRLNKSYVVSLYGISSITLAANLGITLWLVNSILLALPGEVMSHPILNSPSFSANPVKIIPNYAYVITTIASFIITWCATTIGLLKNYTHRTGKFTYWLLLILPLAYFVSQFLVFSLGLLGPVLILNPIFYGILFTILFTLTKPIGGIIFGIGFWMIARNIRKNNVIRNYLIISAYGFLLLFASNQAIVLTFAYYPPSKDASLRREIRRLAIKESKLLDSIGSAQIEDEVRKRVLHIARLNKSDLGEAGLPSALDEEDVNQYLGDVLKEINTIKKKGSFANEKS
jgi:hypothetical protein